MENKQAAPERTWANADAETVKEIARLSEVQLAATLTVSIAQDQRATTLTGIYGAAAITLAAASAVALRQVDVALGAAGFMTSAGLFFASLIAAMAARSGNFFLVGKPFSRTNAHAWDAPQLLHAGHAANTEAAIDHNATALARSARYINLAIAVASLTPVAGLLVYAAVSMKG